MSTQQPLPNPPGPSSVNGSSLDQRVERLGRWTAKRTTRRSFLHRLSQISVIVAAGPILANLLMRKADARVCGQSGVTPKCDTFECAGEGHVWGWCWYASDGCCRDGLKKICDCCIVNYPNVHGYCPAGTNVACIVESCGKDPRVLTVDLTPVAWNAEQGYFPAADLAGNVLASKVVIVDDGDPLRTYIAAPLAGALGIPLIPVSSTGLTDLDLQVISQLDATEALMVGAVSGPTWDGLAAAGMSTRTIASGTDLSIISQDVARFMIRISNVNRTVTIAQTGFSAAAGPLAATFAAVSGFPLLVDSSDTATLGLPTFYIGPEPSDAGVPSERTIATNLPDLSRELADIASVLPFVDAGRLALVPEGSSDIAGMVNCGAPVVLHPPGILGPVEEWIQNHALQFGDLTEVFYIKGPGELLTDQYWSLQGAVNGFRTDQLMGVSGQGLPVIRQPFAERPIGLAKTDGALINGSAGTPDYWTSIGQTFRG